MIMYCIIVVAMIFYDTCLTSVIGNCVGYLQEYPELLYNPGTLNIGMLKLTVGPTHAFHNFTECVVDIKPPSSVGLRNIRAPSYLGQFDALLWIDCIICGTLL